MNFMTLKHKAKLAYVDMRRRLGSARFDVPDSHLTEFQSELVAAIEKDGAFVTTLQGLGIPVDRACVSEIEALFDSITFSAEGRKTFKGGPPQDKIDASVNLIRWGLNETFLDLAESYLRVPVNYRGFTASLDLPDGNDTETRRWHIDAVDTRSFKMIVYVNDVDAGSGPFEFIPRPVTPKFSSRDYVKGRITDDVMESAVPRDKWVTCTGKAGTVVLADTCRMFHRGKPSLTDIRQALFFAYTTRRPLNPEYSASMFNVLAFAAHQTDLTARQRAAIGLP